MLEALNIKAIDEYLMRFHSWHNIVYDPLKLSVGVFFMSVYFAKYRGYMYATVNWNLSNHSCPKTIYEIVLQSFFSVRSEKNFLLILFLVPGFMHFMEMKNKTIKCKQNVNFIF